MPISPEGYFFLCEGCGYWCDMCRIEDVGVRSVIKGVVMNVRGVVVGVAYTQEVRCSPVTISSSVIE